MTIRPYEAARDLRNLQTWCNLHGIEDPAPLLPPLGIIVDEIFAVFLIETNCGICFIDFFIGDPTAPRIAIKNSLEAGCIYLDEAAKKLGYKRVFAMVDRPSTEALCIAQGLTLRPDVKVYMRSF